MTRHVRGLMPPVPKKIPIQEPPPRGAPASCFNCKLVSKNTMARTRTVMSVDGEMRNYVEGFNTTYACSAGMVRGAMDEAHALGSVCQEHR